MQAIGGCNADPDSFDACDELLAYGCGPCVIVQSLKTYETVSYVPLNYGIVTCVRFFCPSELIVGTCNGNLLLLDIVSKTVKSTLQFESSITHLAVFESDVLLSTALNGLVFVNVASGRLETVKEFFSDLRCTALSLVKFHDTVVMGIARPDGSVQIFVPATESTVTMDGSAWTMSIRFCEDESKQNLLMATGSQERVIKVWRITSEESSTISQLGSAVASHSTLNFGNGVLHVELMGVMNAHSDWVNAIDFFGEKTLASASFDGQVLIWNTVGLGDFDISIRLGTTAVGDDQSGFFGCKLLGPNDVLAVSRNGGFSRWIDGKSVRCFAGHADIVTGLTFTGIGCIMSVGLDKVGRVYQKDGQWYRESARPLIHGHSIHDVGVISDVLYAFAGDEKCVRLLRPTQCFAKHLPGSVLSTYPDLPFASMVPPLALDNKVIQTPEDVEVEFAPLVPSDFMKDRIPDSHEMWLTRWPEVKSLWGHERELRQMTISNGDWFATGDDHGGFAIWDKTKLERRGTYVREPTKSLTTAIAAAPDSSLLLQVLENGLIKLIDPATASVIKSIQGPNGLYGGAWSTTSEYFAVAGLKGLFVYERDGNLAGSLDDVSVTAVEYISMNQLLVGMESGTVQLFEYNASARSFTVKMDFAAHSGRVNDIKFNPATKEVMTCGDDHVILIESLPQ